MRKLRLIEDRAGVVYFDCPQGRPLTGAGIAPTVSILTSKNKALSPAVSAAAATQGTANTTIAAWSASTPRTLTVAAITGFAVGETYLITDAAGRRTRVVVVGLITGSKTLYLADAPEFDLTAGDVIVSTRISYSLVAGQTATRDLNYRCEWIYKVGDQVYVIYTLFDVVRHDLFNAASVSGFRDYRPELASAWEELLGAERSYTRRLDEAYWRVVDELEGKREKPWCHAIVDWQQAEYVVYEKLLLDMAEGGFIPAAYDAAAWLDARRREYTRVLESWMGGIRWLDEDDDNVEDDGEAGKDVRSVRLVL